MDYFETNIISNKHDRFIYPLRWLIFCVIFFSLPMILFIALIDLSNPEEAAPQAWLIFAAYFMGVLIFNGLLKILSQKFFRKGKLLISKDELKVILKTEKQNYIITELRDIQFNRKSNFHKDEFNFGVYREHGNTLSFKTKNDQNKKFEFQINSTKHSKEFDRLIAVLQKQHGLKIEFKSI